MGENKETERNISFMTTEATYPLEVNTLETWKGFADYQPPCVEAYETCSPMLAAHKAIHPKQGPWVLTHIPTGGACGFKLRSLAYTRLFAKEIVNAIGIGDELRKLHTFENDKATRKILGRARRKAYDRMRQE